MSGETNLDRLIATMRPALHPGTYVFATTRDPYSMQDLGPRMVFREDEGTTLILLREEADRAALAHTFPSRMITLNVHSSLEAVGFLAAITARLAKLDIGVNPVSAFYHDHLFVPVDAADAVMAALEAMVKES